MLPNFGKASALAMFALASNHTWEPLGLTHDLVGAGSSCDTILCALEAVVTLCLEGLP